MEALFTGVFRWMNIFPSDWRERAVWIDRFNSEENIGAVSRYDIINDNG